MDDAGELAAGLAQLGFRFAREARVRSGAVDDEDAPDQRAPELLADAVGLLELVMRRYERASTILTSNRPVEDWGKLLGDNAAVSAHLADHPAGPLWGGRYPGA